MFNSRRCLLLTNIIDSFVTTSYVWNAKYTYSFLYKGKVISCPFAPCVAYSRYTHSNAGFCATHSYAQHHH